MPVQPNILPAIEQVPVVVQNPQELNNNTSQRHSHANQPWVTRLHQTVIQAIPNATPTQLGFDAQTYPPTYKAVGGNLYSLKFSNNGSATYPFSTITVPSFGIYDIKVVWNVDPTTGGGAGAAVDLITFIQINGVSSTETILPTPNNSITTSASAFDTLQLNPNDQIKFLVEIADSSGATLNTAPGHALIYTVIRYLGLT